MDNAKLESNFQQARANVAKCIVGDKRSEQVYGQAYQALVAAGLRPQIKRKYRG